jgi:hypothetical protein
VERTLFYHASCPDGFGAAWAAWRAWGAAARYVARGHEDRVEARSVEGQLVVFADIAPQRDELRDLAEATAQLVVLDHHVTARDRLSADPSLENLVAAGGHELHFDLEHSGAILAWRWFHPREPAPELLRYVEDQDLWHFDLPRSEQVNAAIGSRPMRFEAWEELARRGVDELAREGESIVRVDRLEVERALRAAHPVALPGGRIEAVNAQRSRSAIGHELAKRASYGPSWGLVYRLTGRRVDLSIYSVGELDVAKLAEGYGGGGHRNAAGFQLSLDAWLTLLV